MKVLLKYILAILIVVAALFACATGKVAHTPEESEIFNTQSSDSVAISNDSLEYEIIIIEPGFNIWLNSVAKPEGYYSQHFLENRNRIYVINWNQRVQQPFRYSPDLYTMQIDYDPFIDYGYEVNYKLYNYFIYFQRKYNQRLAGFVPRI
ncbi:DUF6146 family protein [Sinomicrobium kalidii]|uniref:DUF6146 family protein n=1 Tax=Sinomicrobium kalidii TaxID=2900738 RepID=UPI001E2BEF87|nr:DUF6146 family protein [Sinomicrobium kalidii]UGU16362.1 DUF6146 family protein [Sinomicrobium kalidii]